MDIRFFDRDLERFISRLEAATVAKILRTIDLLSRFGNLLQMPHSRKMSRNLFELRIRGRQEIRIFYTFYHGTIVLLYGFVKKTERTPGKELLAAQMKKNALERT